LWLSNISQTPFRPFAQAQCNADFPVSSGVSTWNILSARKFRIAAALPRWAALWKALSSDFVSDDAGCFNKVAAVEWLSIAITGCDLDLIDELLTFNREGERDSDGSSSSWTANVTVSRDVAGGWCTLPEFWTKLLNCWRISVEFLDCAMVSALVWECSSMSNGSAPAVSNLWTQEESPD
jgi:hypothetical protein